MLYVIYPNDSSTEFLLKIPAILQANFGDDILEVISVNPSDESYKEVIEKIEILPKQSTILFMGHGQDNCLYGAESKEFEKKPLLKGKEIGVFGEQNIFLLACNSNEYLKSTFKYSKVAYSIGFGSLPTDMVEVDNNRRFADQGITKEIIETYKNIIVELVVSAFSHVISNKLPFKYLSNYMLLFLNKKISEVILGDPSDQNNRVLADLLFQMKNEMIFI